LLSSPAPAGSAQGEVVDRVICVVNNDAITDNELNEAEAIHYYETRESPRSGEARQELRVRLLQRLIESRLQLQQAEREKIQVEEVEVAEQLGELMGRLRVKTEPELEATLKSQGMTLEAVKKRLREQLMVQRLIRRKVALRISVTEQEIDRYLAENRDKLEAGLSFEARHILFLPEPGRGEDGWSDARRRAEAVAARLRAGEDFAEPARQHSDDGSGKDGGALGAVKRGELAADIEAVVLRLQPGESSAPFRSQVGYHIFKLESRETLGGESLAAARNQIRDILFREKYAARLRDYLVEIRQRAVIDMRL
jgi:peptidyl-prolyl cis-trans isomerase SurA